MCLAIPCKVITIKDDTAGIENSGVQRKASLLLLSDVKIGDYVIVHAGYAIHKIDEADAVNSLRALGEVLSKEFAHLKPQEEIS